MNLIFDFGGVVFQWRPTALLARVLPQHAPTEQAAQALAADFFQSYGGDWSLFDRGLIKVPALARRIAHRIGLAEAEVRQVIDAVPGELQPIAAAVDLLHRLQAAGHRLFYLSNMPVPYADYLEREHAFLGLFEQGVFSARAQLAKPDAEIFRHALGRFGLSAEGTVFIDDHRPNIDVARALGLTALLYTDAAVLEADLRKAGLLMGA
jgi:HAD superfamily hydrolase (TIGR01509 family)